MRGTVNIPLAKVNAVKVGRAVGKVRARNFDRVRDCIAAPCPSVRSLSVPPGSVVPSSSASMWVSPSGDSVDKLRYCPSPPLLLLLRLMLLQRRRYSRARISLESSLSRMNDAVHQQRKETKDSGPSRG